MKVAYASDLHLPIDSLFDNLIDQNFKSILRDQPMADLLILAGDIVLYKFIKQHIKFIDFISTQYKHIIIVEGNHELYATILGDEIELNYPNNVYLLRNQGIEIDGIKFFGGTLWCDLVRSKNKLDIVRNVNCFKMITGLSPAYCSNQYMKFLSECRNFKPDVVISHFAPTHQSIHSQFKDDLHNDYFCNNLNQFIALEKPKYWICGHVHHKHNYKIHKTQVLCNPYGYANERSRYGFKLEIFEI